MSKCRNVETASDAGRVRRELKPNDSGAASTSTLKDVAARTPPRPGGVRLIHEARTMRAGDSEPPCGRRPYKASRPQAAT